MAAQALYRKWRPRRFDELIGQEHVVRTLRNALTSNRIHHAYLFTGPRGTGKTTTARLLAKAVNCLSPEDQRPCNECAICQAVNEGRLLDLIEIDAASNTGVDDVRELREKVGFRPNEARYKVYVIDEVHMLSNAAFNALLKTLEEPPPHAIFVLATTEPHKIPATVLSRCQRFDFHRIHLDKIVARLEWLTDQERIEAERDALTLIARHATGSMRDAESLLDQLTSYGDSGITVAEVRSVLGTGASETVIQVTDALVRGDVAGGLSTINTAMDEGADPRQFARQMVVHLRSLLLLRLGSGVVPTHVSDDQRSRLEAQATNFSARTLAQSVRLFSRAASEAKGGWQPQLPLELAFIEAALPIESENSDPTPRARSASTGTRASSPSGHSPSSSAPAPARPGSASSSPSPSPPTQSSGAIQEAKPTYTHRAPGDGSLTLDILRDRWPEFLNALRPRNLSLEALMRSCEPMAVEGDVIILGFTHKFHRSKVEEDQNKRAVEEALSELVGQQYRVRCVLIQQGRAAAPPPRSTAESPDEQTRSTVEQIIARDPVVRTAVEDLGAEIVQG